jgi:hypothetical protein
MEYAAAASECGAMQSPSAMASAAKPHTTSASCPRLRLWLFRVDISKDGIRAGRRGGSPVTGLSAKWPMTSLGPQKSSAQPPSSSKQVGVVEWRGSCRVRRRAARQRRRVRLVAAVGHLQQVKTQRHAPPMATKCSAHGIAERSGGWSCPLLLFPCMQHGFAHLCILHPVCELGRRSVRRLSTHPVASAHRWTPTAAWVLLLQAPITQRLWGTAQRRLVCPTCPLLLLLLLLVVVMVLGHFDHGTFAALLCRQLAPVLRHHLPPLLGGLLSDQRVAVLQMRRLHRRRRLLVRGRLHRRHRRRPRRPECRTWVGGCHGGGEAGGGGRQGV